MQPLPPPNARSLPLYRLVLTALPILVIWASIGGYLAQRRELALEVAAQDSRNLTKAFEENIRRTVESIDTTIRAMRVARAHDPEHFSLMRWDRESGLSRELMLQLSFTDAQGIMEQSNLGPITKRISLADREHFIGAKALHGDGLFISHPVIGRVSGKWSVQFVRKLIGPNGGFQGIVVASLDPTFLLRFYHSLDIGDASLLILGQDGILKAGASRVGMEPGTDMGNTDLVRGLREMDLGTITTSDVADHIRRIYSWRHVAPYDLTVVVGLSTANALADYKRLVIGFVVLGLVLTAITLVVGGALARNRRAMMQSRAMLQAAVDNISQGLLVVDSDRTVPVLNRRAAELLGLPEDLTHPGVTFDSLLAWQVQIGEFDNDADVQALVAAGGISPQDGKYHRTRRDGTVLEIQTKLVETGLAVRTFTDITEQEHNAAVLAEARDAAEAAARARSEFLAVMSHEIRTPLNGVIGVAGLLEGMDLGHAQRDYVRLICQSGDHLLGLVNDILDFSRLDAARLELESTGFDPRALAEDVMVMLRPQAEAKGLMLTAHLDPSLPRAMTGDPGRLRQILINLLGNAIKFTDQGWVRLDMRAVADAAAGAGKVRLQVAVADSGIGIAPAAIERMFAEFTQADGSISRRYGGSGLGLAIVRRLVELMGGAITVESVPGEGSTFRFHLDLTVNDAAPGENPAAPPQNELDPGLKILVAEDNATNRLVALRLLERLGCKADAVCNGAEAVETLRRQAYDLVLMDVMMPEMDGLSATKAIRRGETADRHIPIVGLTAHARTENLEECIAAGMDAVTTKPVTANSLRAAITEGLTKAADRTPSRAAEDASPRLQELLDLLGEEGLRDILNTFAEDARTTLGSLRDAARQGQTEAVYRLAHSMAGAARNVGAADLAVRAKTLEETVGRLDSAGMLAEVAAMQAMLDAVLTEYGVAAG